MPMADDICPGLAEALAEYMKHKVVTSAKAEPSDDSSQQPADVRHNGALEPGEDQSD